jgi:hypothetical protein
MLKRFLFSSLILASFATAAHAKGRCEAPDSDDQQAMDAVGIVDVCQTVDVRAEAAPELAEPKIMGVRPSPVDQAVVSSPAAGVIRFTIPRGYDNYVICGYSLDKISAMPPLGGYVKHGWENLTDRSIDYGWELKRRGLGRGDTRLIVDVRFSFVPAANLGRARDAELCMTGLTPEPWREAH